MIYPGLHTILQSQNSHSDSVTSSSEQAPNI